MNPRVIGIVPAVVLGLWAAACADTLTKTSGEVVNGKVIAEDDKAVLFEAHQEGLVAQIRIARSDIRSLAQESQAGPGYYPLPIEGEIGTEVTAAGLTEGLKQARAAKCDYVVLVIDSSGGSIDEMFKMVNVIREARDLRVVAYVERGISAAGILAMSCRRLYVKENGTIGAAMPWQFGPDGTPQDVEGKFRSAFAGDVRGLVAGAGHPGLVAAGMIEPGLELALVRKDDKLAVVEAGPGSLPEGATVLKRKGTVLTLTGKEALACGLAEGNADGMVDLGRALGVGAWHRVDDLGWNYMKHQASLARKQGEKQAYLKSVGSELEKLRDRADKAVADGKAASEGLDSLKKDYDAELAEIEKRYQDAVKVVPTGEDKQTWVARAAKTHDTAVGELNEKYRAPLATLVERIRESKAEFDQAKEQFEAMVAGGPQ